jgi:DNA-binding CsgD family transcriptional regulator
LRLIGGRLHAGSPEATHRLHALVAAASIRSERRRGGTMSVSRPDLRHPLLVSVAPAKADRFAGFASGPSVIVCVSDLAGNDAPPSQRLRDLFGLSPAETRVALALFDGLSPREAAESLGVSFYTVRGHLVRLFEKTQTKRQSELIKLIQRAAGLAAD